jgi:hypothetical protein
MTSSEDAALTARSGVLVAHAAKVNMVRTAAVFFKGTPISCIAPPQDSKSGAPVAAHCLKSGSGWAIAMRSGGDRKAL